MHDCFAFLLPLQFSINMTNYSSLIQFSTNGSSNYAYQLKKQSIFMLLTCSMNSLNEMPNGRPLKEEMKSKQQIHILDIPLIRRLLFVIRCSQVHLNLNWDLL